MTDISSTTDFRPSTFSSLPPELGAEGYPQSDYEFDFSPKKEQSFSELGTYGESLHSAEPLSELSIDNSDIDEAFYGSLVETSTIAAAALAEPSSRFLAQTRGIRTGLAALGGASEVFETFNDADEFERLVNEKGGARFVGRAAGSALTLPVTAPAMAIAGGVGRFYPELGRSIGDTAQDFKKMGIEGGETIMLAMHDGVTSLAEASPRYTGIVKTAVSTPAGLMFQVADLVGRWWAKR